MLGRLSGKALLALGAVVIAGLFIGLMIKSRGPTDDELAQRDRLEKFGEEQEQRRNAGACQDAVGHAVAAAGDYLTSRYGDGAADAIRAIAQHRCEADAWSPAVVKCLDRVTSDNEMQRCIGQLEDHQRRAVEAEMKAFALRPPKAPPDAAIDADEFGLSDPDLGTPTPALPDACVEYELLIDKLATCDKLPQASRDAMKQGFDAMRSSWSSMGTMSQDARDAMGSACKQANDALTQGMAAMCGW